MHITILIILTYIACCVRVGAAPWKFFQLNAQYFSNDQGIFSKLKIDTLIPEQWKLYQVADEPGIVPSRYPVFLKPEWGQNAHGIHRADSFDALVDLRKTLSDKDTAQKYILQEGAPGTREFEIFSIDTDKQDGQHDIVSVTEAVNKTESYPINSKYNNNTQYVDITRDFTSSQLDSLAAFINDIGDFAISRVSVRANNIDELLAGHFHVIEVNLFLPMPINLLDKSYSMPQRIKFIGKSMMQLALATKAIKPQERPPAIFTRMMLYGRQKRVQHATHKLFPRRSIL